MLCKLKIHTAYSRTTMNKMKYFIHMFTYWLHILSENWIGILCSIQTYIFIINCICLFLHIKVAPKFFNFIFLVDTITDVPNFSPLCLPPTSSPLFSSLWPSPHCCSCLRVMHICSLGNPYESHIIFIVQHWSRHY